MATETTTRDAAPSASRSLVSLLGASRATIVEHLRGVHDASVAELAALLGISEVATRRHLGVLEDEALVVAHTVNQGRGRPAARYELTTDARRLFPSAHDQLAADALDFLEQQEGGAALRAFLRWRMERQIGDLGEAVTADDLEPRLAQLADALSEAGFSASVAPDGQGFTLTQQHCAIEDLAREHPELCAYEAATFSQVLGSDVRLRRRETLTRGSAACVCCVTARDVGPAASGTGAADEPQGRVPVVPDDLTSTGGALPLVAPAPRAPTTGQQLPNDHPRTDPLREDAP